MKCRKCKNEIPDGSIFCNWCGERQLKERKKKDEIKVPTPRQLPSGKWFIQLRAEGQSVTEDTEALCIAKARAIRAGFLEQKKKPEKITLMQAAEKYIDSRRATASPSTIRSYEKIKRLRFQNMMNKRLQEITIAKIQSEINAMNTPDADGKKLSAKTIKDAYCFLKTVLDYHNIELEYKSISLPVIQPSPYNVLTPQEISILFKALPGTPCELPILLAIWLGLRRSEILALEKSDFDLKRGTVTIKNAIVQDENNNYVLKGTKTATSARTIDCPDYILDKIKDLPDGKIYNHNAGYILKCLHKLCEENGLPSIRLHDLRHINASVMLLLNIPDKYAMERGGWATKQTMTGRYQHTYDEEKRETDRKINDFFSALLIP